MQENFYAPVANEKNASTLDFSRNKDEVITIGDGIRVQIVDVKGNRVRLSLDVPPSVPVYREEVHEFICASRAAKNAHQEPIERAEKPTTAVTKHVKKYKTSADGRWVLADYFRVNHAPKVNGKPPSNRTLQDWRYKGKRAKDKKSGCDVKGNVWETDQFDPTVVRYWIEHK